MPTISTLEEGLEQSLERLRANPTSADIERLKVLLPPGWRIRVELRDKNNRKKRANADASNWSPADGEVRLYFEPEKGSAALAAPAPELTAGGDEVLVDLIRRVHALEAAPGRAFISLSWFMKELPRTGWAWAQLEAVRRQVVERGVEERVLLTYKVANPKQPAFATTAIRLNMEHPLVAATVGAPRRIARFNPVPVLGEPISEQIIRERR